MKIGGTDDLIMRTTISTFYKGGDEEKEGTDREM